MTGQQLMACVFRLYRTARYTKVAWRPATLRVLSRFPKLDLSVLQAGTNGSRVLIKGTDVNPTASHCQFLLSGSELVGRLIREAGATLKELPDGVLLEVGGVKLKLQNWEELFIASEVFATGVYNLNFKGDFVLIDIGMNVGTTSLFFAARTGCRRIYAFEPFPKTIEKAKVNFSLNPLLANKIQVSAKGLASSHFSANLDYVEEFKGSIGLNGLPNYVSSGLDSTKTEKVRVDFIAATDAIAEVTAQHSKTPLVCKLDCEGAEYEIVESLASAGLLSNITCFMIEWHQKGAALIERILIENGFSLFSFSPNAPTHSMIYAWRQPGATPLPVAV